MTGAITSPRNFLSEFQSAPAIFDYDCIVGNVATYLHLNGINPDVVLGRQLTVSPLEVEGSWSYSHIGATQIAAAVTASGLRADFVPTDQAPVHGPHVAVGDGFDMPWTPYFGRKHLEHGFLMLDGGLAYDAYDTLTEFGAAKPQIISLDVVSSVPISAQIELSIEPGGPQVTPSPVVHADEVAVSAYVSDLDSRVLGLEQLAVDTWVLSRARRVNTRYGKAVGLDVTSEVKSAADAWTHAAEAVYFALRRQSRGRDVPETYVEAVRAAVEADRVLCEVWK